MGLFEAIRTATTANKKCSTMLFLTYCLTLCIAGIVATIVGILEVIGILNPQDNYEWTKYFALTVGPIIAILYGGAIISELHSLKNL